MGEPSRLLPLLTWRSAITESTLKPTQRHVALTLSLYMNEKGGSAHPGVIRLAHDTGYDRSTVLRALSSLEEAKWLIVVEPGRGTQRGEKRRATTYASNIPEAESDRSSSATGGSVSSDRSSSAQRPVVLCDPISSLNSPENSPPGGAPQNGDARPQMLTAYFVDQYRLTHGGRDPANSWKGQAGNHAKSALRDGFTEADIKLAFNAIAKENRAPSALNFVLADLHANR